MSVFVQRNGFHAAGAASHRAHGVLGEAYHLAVVRSNQHLALAVGQRNAYQFVALAQAERDNTVRTRVGVRLQRGLLHQAVLGSEDEVMRVDILLVVQALHIDERTHFIALLQVNHVLDSAALALLVALGYLIHFQPVEASHLGEEHHRGVHRRLVYILDEVLVARGRSLRADTAAGLRAELAQRRALDIAEVGDSNNHIIVGIHILGVELRRHLHNLRAALVGIFLLNLNQFVLDKVVAHGLAVEQVVEVGNQFLQLRVLGFQLVDTQACQLAQTHIHDGFRLQVIKVKARLKVRLCVCRCAAGADDTHYLVDVVHRGNQALQDMRALLCFLQLEAGAARYDLHAVLNECAYQLLEVQQHRAAFHQRNAVHGERRLQGGELIEFIEYYLRIRVALHVNHNTDVALRLVADVGNTFYLLVADQFSDVLHQLALHNAVRQLRDDNPLASVVLGLDVGVRADNNASPTRLISIAHALIAVYCTARREVGRFDMLHQFVHRYLLHARVCYPRLNVLDIRHAAVYHLA